MNDSGSCQSRDRIARRRLSAEQADWGILMPHSGISPYGRCIPPSRLTPCHLPLGKGGFEASAYQAAKQQFIESIHGTFGAGEEVADALPQGDGFRCIGSAGGVDPFGGGNLRILEGLQVHT